MRAPVSPWLSCCMRSVVDDHRSLLASLVHRWLQSIAAQDATSFVSSSASSNRIHMSSALRMLRR